MLSKERHQTATGPFSRDQFTELSQQLGKLKGRFLMSINDVPDIREAFKNFRLASVATTYTVGKKNDSRGTRTELLISNFDWTLEGV